MTEKQAGRKFAGWRATVVRAPPVLAETECSFCGPSTVVLRPQAGGFASHPFGWFALVTKHEYLILSMHNSGQCIPALKTPTNLPDYDMAAPANSTK